MGVEADVPEELLKSRNIRAGVAAHEVAGERECVSLGRNAENKSDRKYYERRCKGWPPFHVGIIACAPVQTHGAVGISEWEEQRELDIL